MLAFSDKSIFVEPPKIIGGYDLTVFEDYVPSSGESMKVFWIIHDLADYNSWSDYRIETESKRKSFLKGHGVSNIRQLQNIEDKIKLVRSVNKNVRCSTRKLNPILKAIVGKKVDIAIRNLTFSDKRITNDVKKTLSSAIANAENNFQYDIDRLIVKEAYCGKQVVMRRFRPRAKGRAAPIKKPYSNLTIILSEMKKVEKHGAKS